MEGEHLIKPRFNKQIENITLKYSRFYLYIQNTNRCALLPKDATPCMCFTYATQMKFREADKNAEFSPVHAKFA